MLVDDLAKVVFYCCVLSALNLLLCYYLENPAMARNQQHSSTKAGQNAKSGNVYPQFRSREGYVIHWLPEQMPLKVYVSPGQTMENIIDPETGVSVLSVDSRDRWPDWLEQTIENQQIAQLPIAEGYLPQHYQAVISGIARWKAFEKEGLFSFVSTDDPTDADIYIFWVSHFVDKHGFGLFSNDIRGYTQKYSNWYKAILENKPVKFKPVVVLLRTANQQGNPMDIAQMQASAAHEFGHALGIDQHSTNPHDLMSLYYGNGTISSNDAATIRYLYHLTPDLVP